MDREAYFINSLIKRKITHKLGDDGVIIGKSVYAMDLFCEGVHFLVPHFSYYTIAKKAFLVNISDILAMGAKPKYALLGISFSHNMTKGDIGELQRGFSDICKEFKIKIIGGDTIKDSKLNIAITMIGDSAKKPILRSKFKVGDIIFHTRDLGRSVKEMRYLYRGGKIPKQSKFFTPKLNPHFIYDILPFVRGGMDISDGLFYELNRISSQNSVKFKFFSPVNRHKATSGEEYEFLFSIAKSDENRLQRIAKKHRIKLTKIAKMLRGKERFHCISHHT